MQQQMKMSSSGRFASLKNSEIAKPRVRGFAEPLEIFLDVSIRRRLDSHVPFSALLLRLDVDTGQMGRVEREGYEPRSRRSSNLRPGSIPPAETAKLLAFRALAARNVQRDLHAGTSVPFLALHEERARSD